MAYMKHNVREMRLYLITLFYQIKISELGVRARVIMARIE